MRSIKGACARRGLLGVSSCRYTDCKCAAGLVAVLLCLEGTQRSRCVSVCVCVLWRHQLYSNLLSLSNYSLVKCETKSIVVSPVPPPPPPPPPLPAPAGHFGSGQAQHGHPSRHLSEGLADIMTSRGRLAPQYHDLRQQPWIACFVLLCLY